MGGPAFSLGYARLLDETLTDLFDAAPDGPAALVALGSYARKELCPGSDVDLLLVHGGGRHVKAMADALWYPLWDAGLIVGHATRTVKEAVSVADADLQVLTSMLDARHLSGDEELTAELLERIRRLAEKRRHRLVDMLAAAAETRREALIADLLEPNLKEGGGGLRDLHALDWAGWVLGDPGGLDALVNQGYLHPADPAKLREARELLLTVRIALHRVTGGKGDDLRLQEQDAVAAWVGRGDADALARELAESARTVAWITSDVWSRLRSTRRGPLGRIARRDHELAPGVLLRDGRVTLSAQATADGATALRLALSAAEREAPIDREALAVLGSHTDDEDFVPDWHAGSRDDLLALLRCGERAIAVVEALEQEGVWTALFPEWRHVRSLPQRNAYHRFAVDRHLLEAVARCAALLDAGPEELHEIDADVGARIDHPELLPLTALLHDMGKGLPGDDHSEVGAEAAEAICRRVGLDDEAVARVGRVVRHHLLLADTATRRDLSEEATVAKVARLVGDVPTLELLYLLTVGDSQATGPAAWGPVKAVLVRELFVKAHNLLERGEIMAGAAEERRWELAALVGRDAADAYLDSMPPSYAPAFTAEQMARHRELLDGGDVAAEWSEGIEQRPVCTVVAPDRPGMLSAVAGVMSLHGLSVQELAAHTRDDGMALEVLRVYDGYGRLAKEGGEEAVIRDVEAALRGALDVAARVQERAEQYAPSRRRLKPPHPPTVVVDQESSDFATVVEVHADDRIGLLFQVTQVFADLGLDVHLAKVNTIGDRVVDAFYVRDGTGSKIGDERVIEALRQTLLGRLQRG